MFIHMKLTKREIGDLQAQKNISHASTKPTSFVEAVGHKEWKEAMINEYDVGHSVINLFSLMSNSGMVCRD
jgi:hypothetical protein